MDNCPSASHATVNLRRRDVNFIPVWILVPSIIREFLPLLTSTCFHWSQRVNVSRHVPGVLIYGSDTWAVKDEDLTKLERNDMMMVRWSVM